MSLYQRADRIAALVAALFTLASLVLVLLLPSDILLSASNTDMVSEFASWRAYLADNLRQGHLPLWNSFTYGGQPFLGGFESAVLYPPNLFFLWLPLARALNLSMLLHLVLLGWGIERWATCRGLNPWAAGLAGFVMSLSGADAMPDTLRQFVAAHPGDYRVLGIARPDNGFLLGAGDLGGNNSSLLRRYAEFINFTQGSDPDHPTQYLQFKSIAPLYAMLRFRYAFVPTSEGIRVMESPIPPLPRLLLVSDEKVLAGRNALFSAMHDPSFNPSETVLLESEPEPLPESGATGSARLIADLPDEMMIEADTNKPTLLLITDLYDHNWQVEALPDSAQQSYHLMPADYILRAVPLAAGHHHLASCLRTEGFSDRHWHFCDSLDALDQFAHLGFATQKGLTG